MHRRGILTVLALMVLIAATVACGLTEEGVADSTRKDEAVSPEDFIPYEGPQTPRDSEWLLQSLNGRDSAEGSDITLYHDKAELNVEGGCMGFFLVHKLEDDRIRAVEPGLQVGRLNCGKPQGVRQQAEDILDIMRHLAQVRATDDRFELRGDSGEVAVFVPPAPAEVDAALVGTEWILTSLEGEDALQAPKITLEIGQESIGGNSGCSFYGGEIDKMADGSLLWPKGGGDAMSTEMGCPGKGLDQEIRYQKTLYDIETYRIEDDRLEMRNGESRTTLVFHQESQWKSDPAELVGTSWVLRSTAGKVPREGSVPTVRFEPDKKVFWYDGCQNFSGEYSATENDLTAPSFGVVNGDCMKPEAFEDPESCVAACFGPEGDYRLRDGLLEIRSEGGETTSILEPLARGEEPKQEGTPWVLRGFVEGVRTTPVSGESSISLTFDRGTLRDEGTMFGSTGCNDYRVAYEHPIARNGPDRLVMAEPTVTKVRCASPDATEDEQRFLGTLRDVGYYPDISSNGRMSLDTEDGRKLVFSAPE